VPTAEACSQVCESAANGECKYFAFTPKRAQCGAASCELLSDCKPERRPMEGWMYFGRTSSLGEAVADAQWPEQLGTPLGFRVDAQRVPDTAPVQAAGGDLSIPLGVTAMLGASLDEATEYVCDVSDGKKADDAAAYGTEYANSCTQVCLPVAFWGPAMKNGVQRSKCKENGCTTFVAARKYAGVPYNLFNCSCPSTNASALYTCPSQDSAPSTDDVPDPEVVDCNGG